MIHFQKYSSGIFLLLALSLTVAGCSSSSDDLDATAATEAESSLMIDTQEYKLTQTFPNSRSSRHLSTDGQGDYELCWISYGGLDTSICHVVNRAG